MTDDISVTFSRRRVLAGVGAIGVGSIGAGMGTTAYFSDDEQFSDNVLVAGSLDLKVDWTEHYSDWSLDEDDVVVGGESIGDFPVVMTNGDPDAVPDDYVGLPYFGNPLIAVPRLYVPNFMNNTAVEAYPDVDDDGLPEQFDDTYQVGDAAVTVGPACETGADTPEHLDPTASFRTDGPDTRLADGSPAPLVHLQDVKPGDFGEITFSLHLCDNPGYIWLNGDLQANAENGVTEPEAKDPDEDDGSGVADPDAGDETSGELADALRVVIWYDFDADNVFDRGVFTGELEESAILGHTAPMTLSEAMNELSTGNGIPLDGDIPINQPDEFDELTDAPTSDERQCFSPVTDIDGSYFIGLAWWLPVDHANEIQSDSVSFDLGFYAEQCRHNDGSGQTPEGT